MEDPQLLHPNPPLPAEPPSLEPAKSSHRGLYMIVGLIVVVTLILVGLAALMWQSVPSLPSTTSDSNSFLDLPSAQDADQAPANNPTTNPHPSAAPASAELEEVSGLLNDLNQIGTSYHNFN